MAWSIFIIEMIKAAGDGVIVCLTPLFSHIIYIGRVSDIGMVIINLFKGKGDALSCENDRGLKLQEYVMKILEHISSILSYGNKSLSVTCSLFFCQVEAPLMQFSYLDSYKESTCKRKKASILHLST